jgi:prepilin-type N-terminal cleavage/methylation domain-containing protein
MCEANVFYQSSNMRNQTSNIRHQTSRRGFSLIEVLISIILVGLSITALVVASNSFTMANGAGADLSTAEFLIEQIRELTAMLAVIDPQSGTAVFGPEEIGVANYDDVDDLNGATYSPPIGSDRTVLNDLAGFSQHIVVQNVSQSNFNTVDTTHSSKFVRITVTILLNNRQISSASWIRARY